MFIRHRSSKGNRLVRMQDHNILCIFFQKQFFIFCYHFDTKIRISCNTMFYSIHEHISIDFVFHLNNKTYIIRLFFRRTIIIRNCRNNFFHKNPYLSNIPLIREAVFPEGFSQKILSSYRKFLPCPKHYKKPQNIPYYLQPDGSKQKIFH